MLAQSEQGEQVVEGNAADQSQYRGRDDLGDARAFQDQPAGGDPDQQRQGLHGAGQRSDAE